MNEATPARGSYRVEFRWHDGDTCAKFNTQGKGAFNGGWRDINDLDYTLEAAIEHAKSDVGFDNRYQKRVVDFAGQVVWPEQVTPPKGVDKFLVDSKLVSDRALKLPTGDKERKELPVFRGPLMYFPHALLEVARVCKVGNDQHNPGQPMHWARGKSTEQMDTALRHMMDHGLENTRDTDGTYHLAKAAWRILAELQLTIERDAKETK